MIRDSEGSFAAPRASNTGLILVIFFTEPVGLAPHNLTEPERKTMSPVTSTPGVQRCVHMLVSLLKMMQYCINHVG